MKIISWNVNGVRAVLKKGFKSFLNVHRPDIVCLQEVKAERDQVDFDFPGYHVFWHHSTSKKGYSGTAIISKIEPLSVVFGMDGVGIHDDEGRVITAEYEKFYLVTVYTPNSGRDLAKLSFREKTWDPLFLDHLRMLDRKKPVIFCGDLNVAHKEIDLANPKSNHKNAGFTPQERASFDNLVKAGFVDSFRHFHPGQEHAYSWWTYRNNARERNIGWRLDYFCVSKGLVSQLNSADILAHVKGSDHCPVELQLNNNFDIDSH